MKKKSKLFVLIFILNAIAFFNQAAIVFANDDLTFDVKAQLPENQVNTEIIHYDLRMEPSMQQALALEITNKLDQEQVFQLEINDATTNNVGKIDYTRRADKERDSTLKIALSDIATVQSEITVPAHKTITTHIRLSMPNELFDGMILGGVRVIKKDPALQDSQERTVATYDNSYTLAIMLTETDLTVEPELNLLKVYPSQEKGKNVVTATIQNTKAINAEQITYTAEVFKKNSNKLLYQAQAVNYRMAPNSNFDFCIDWESQPFKAGKYRLHMIAESLKTDQKWDWVQEFEITSAEAKKLNRSATDLKKDGTLLLIMIGCGLIAVVAGLLLVILISRRKRNEQEKQRLLKKEKERQQPKKRKPKSTQTKKSNQQPKRKPSKKTEQQSVKRKAPQKKKAAEKRPSDTPKRQSEGKKQRPKRRSKSERR